MRSAQATAWAGRFTAREGLTVVEVLHERCAGMDISKRDVKVCIRVPGRRGGRYRNEVTTFGSMTGQILELRAFLLEQQVTLVVMESTGDYWKPFYYVLENAPFECGPSLNLRLKTSSTVQTGIAALVGTVTAWSAT